MKKKLILTVLGFFLISGVLLADPVVDFEKRKYKATAGDIVEVRMVIKDFDRLDAGGVNLQFDPSVLQVKNVELNTNVWRFANRGGDVDNATGTIRNIGFSDFQGVSGPEAVIGTIRFVANKHGRSRIVMSESDLNPFATDGGAVSVKYGTATVSLSRPINKKSRQD